MTPTLDHHEPRNDREDQQAAEKNAEARSPATQRSEEIHIRNFDTRRTHSLTIKVRDSQGLVFANRYQLTPGKTASELGQVPPGEYEIHVKLDGRRRQTARCEVDGTLDKTVLVEVGNGTVSVTEGLYS